LLISAVCAADEGLVQALRRAGSQDREVRPVKARLYRTALTVSVVAILLEGLGAGWKWG
jgi:hypothetical protein